MGYLKSNAMPIAIGVALGMFVVPYVMNFVKSKTS